VKVFDLTLARAELIKPTAMSCEPDFDAAQLNVPEPFARVVEPVPATPAASVTIEPYVIPAFAPLRDVSGVSI